MALLDSAERAARKHGLNGFSYADLAADVGIRKASIHYHFPTKANLALNLIDRYTARFFDALDAADAELDTAADRLRAYMKLNRDAIDEGGQLCLCVSFCLGRESLDAAVLERLNAYHVRLVQWLTDVFAVGKSDETIAGVESPAAEANACLAQMEGAQLMARAALDVTPFDDAAASLRSRIANA